MGSGRTEPRLWVLGLPLLAFLALPVAALVLSSTPNSLLLGLQHPLVAPALWLSLKTSALSLGVVLLTGTPLAWWLARSDSRASRWLEPLVELPIVIPPAVIGIALLDAFGRGGLFGPALAGLGWSIPFTTTAVVLAQVVVSAPFYVQSAAAAFRGLDDDLMIVARTLGVGPARTFFGVALPAALPGVVSGAALSWARAIGEFGATLLFAGSLSGRTQTLPLAIFQALQQDVAAARALALLLAVVAIAVLVSLRLLARRRP